MPRDPNDRHNPARSMPASPALADFISAAGWVRRELPPPESLLGEVLCRGGRWFVGGPTGLGKSMLIHGIGTALAHGIRFGPWIVRRPCRVLVVDGEMASDLLRQRIADAARRADDAPPSANLFVVAQDDADALAARFPDIGEFAPLNTDKGRAFLLATIDALGGVDVVIFDNKQCLLCGDAKEESSWNDTMPLVKELTRRGIAQIWVDHTGHDTSRLYGSKVKEWSFDAVSLLEPAAAQGADLSFTLRFTKARRRTPANRADFEPVTLALQDDRWSWSTVAKPPETVRNRPKPSRPEPGAAKLYEVLVDLLARGGGTTYQGKQAVTEDQWRAHACARGVLDPEKPNSVRSLFSKWRRQLVIAEWVAKDAGHVWCYREPAAG